MMQGGIREILRNRRPIWCILLALAVYGINKFFLIGHIPGAIGYFCQCHLNDLVCPLFFLGVAQVIFTWAGYTFRSFWFWFALGTAGGLVWEFLAPVINPVSISDPIDLLCYMAGTIIYYCIIRWERFPTA